MGSITKPRSSVNIMIPMLRKKVLGTLHAIQKHSIKWVVQFFVSACNSIGISLRTVYRIYDVTTHKFLIRTEHQCGFMILFGYFLELYLLKMKLFYVKPQYSRSILCCSPNLKVMQRARRSVAGWYKLVLFLSRKETNSIAVFFVFKKKVSSILAINYHTSSVSSTID
jgi:hypothetical protein